MTGSEQRWKEVKAHIAKGDKAKGKADDHYLAAGLLLKELKAEHDGRGGSWTEWEVKVKEKVASASRAPPN